MSWRRHHPLTKLDVALATTTLHQSRPIIVQTTNEVHCFDNRAEADQAVHALSTAEFDMRKLSLLGKGHHDDRHTLRERSAEEHVRAWTAVGVVWGGLFGLLSLLPESGLAASQGYLVAALVHTLVGAALLGGLAAAAGVLMRPGQGEGTSGGDAKAHTADVYRLVIRGSAEDHAQARRILESSRAMAGRADAANAESPYGTGQVAQGASVHSLQAVGRPGSRYQADDFAPRDAVSRQNTRRERISA